MIRTRGGTLLPPAALIHLFPANLLSLNYISHWKGTCFYSGNRSEPPRHEQHRITK
jgi:hypothetical protein